LRLYLRLHLRLYPRRWFDNESIDLMTSQAEALTIAHRALPPACEALRAEVRAFLAEHLPLHRDAVPQTFSAYDPAFSRKVGARGWIGMPWPRQYGGHERPYLERYVVIEEMIAAGAPILAHHIADRQIGAQLLRFGTEAMRQTMLPKIAAGELYFSLGMSEPDAGSDLASIRTRAERVDGGWLVNGRKIWNTSHHAQYMLALVRTAKAGEQRHAGMSQLIIDLQTPGVSVRRIRNLMNVDGFSEVLFDNALIPAENLLGEEGRGWQQVTTELGDERAGPERYTSSYPLLAQMIDHADPADERALVALGKLVAEAKTLRNMSVGLAAMAARGADIGTASALYKDLGTTFEQRVPDVASDLYDLGELDPEGELARAMRRITQVAPAYSLRGGSREVLRGMIARKLGLR